MGTKATGKVTLLHRFAGIRPTKPGNRSRGGWTSISSDHSIMLTPAGVESLHLRDAPAELTSRTDRPSRLRAETATHPDSHVRQPCETATRYHRLARGNPPATLLWGEVPPLAQRAGLLGLLRVSPPRPSWATVPLPRVSPAEPASQASQPNPPLGSQNGRALGWPRRMAMRDGHTCRPLQDRWGNRPSGLAAASPCPHRAQRREQAATDAVRDSSPLPG